MSRRKKIIIALIVAVILVIIILLLLNWPKAAINTNTPANVNITTNQSLPSGETNTNAGVTVNVNAGSGAAAPQGPTLEDNLKKIALNFAERFGSFSNQNQFQNIEDLKILMSNKMIAWADKYVRDALAKNTDTSVYYGITTKAINASAVKINEKAGQAEILVYTQRWEAKEVSTNIRVFYQNISIKFVFENGNWKVDGAYWQ
jgi:hypothetical protein